MAKKSEKTNTYILTIVGIVAIVGVILLVTSQQQEVASQQECEERGGIVPQIVSTTVIGEDGSEEIEEGLSECPIGTLYNPNYVPTGCCLPE